MCGSFLPLQNEHGFCKPQIAFKAREISPQNVHHNQPQCHTPLSPEEEDLDSIVRPNTPAAAPCGGEEKKEPAPKVLVVDTDLDSGTATQTGSTAAKPQGASSPAAAGFAPSPRLADLGALEGEEALPGSCSDTNQ